MNRSQNFKARLIHIEMPRPVAAKSELRFPYAPASHTLAPVRMNQWSQRTSASTRRLTALSAALRGLEADFGPEHADTFRRDRTVEILSFTA